MKKLVIAVLAGAVLMTSGLQVNAAGLKEAHNAKAKCAVERSKDAVGKKQEKADKVEKPHLEKDKKDNKDKVKKPHEVKPGKKPHEVKPAKKPHELKPGKKPHDKEEVSLERSERCDNPDGSWSIIDYDAKGYCVKITYYMADGTLDCYMEFVNDANGVRLKEYFYDASGALATTSEMFYHEDGKLDYAISHYSDGSYCIQKYNADEKVEEITRYDANGNFAGREVNFFENDMLSGYIVYDEEGNVIQEYRAEVDENGFITYVPVYSEDDGETGYTSTDEYVNADGSKTIMEYVDGMLVKSTYYNANGELESYTTFTFDENYRETGYTTYDANGNVTGQAENRYDENGYMVESKFVDWMGMVSINQYDYVNGYQTVFCYDAEGNFVSHSVYILDENHEYVGYMEYDAEGNLIAEYIMVKDADGNYISVPKEA